MEQLTKPDTQGILGSGSASMHPIKYSIAWMNRVKRGAQMTRKFRDVAHFGEPKLTILQFWQTFSVQIAAYFASVL